jgi:hypothetical protein
MPPNQQTPSQVPPDPNMPPVQPIRRTVIQPLSSEDEIRQAAASSGAPARPSESGVDQTSSYLPGAAPLEATEYENTYQGGLITEPIHPANQARQEYGKLQSLTPKAPAAIKTKKSPVKAIAVVLLIGILGAAAWLFFFNRISSADLVQESVDVSTYLRPKQWSQTSPSVSAFSNKTEQEGGSTAFVSVSEFPMDSSQISAGTEESYDRYRKLVLEQLSENVIRVIISVNAPVDCRADDVELTEYEEDTDKNKTTIGVIKAVASCEMDGSTITMKMRLVAGANDERVRMVIVGGTTVDWIKNAQSFQRMLDGVEERAAAI